MPLIEIHFKGGTQTNWSEWFQGMSVEPISPAEMCLRGQVADYSAVYGILSTMSTLGIKLICLSVTDPPEAGPG